MNQLIVENNGFVYVTPNEKKILLQLDDYISNNSRIPMQSENGVSIAGIITSLLRKHGELCEGTDEGSNEINYLLLDIFMVRELMKEYRPLRVLEIGCSNGVLSYHIGYLLGMFMPESSLVCVCNAIGNESGNKWLERIAMLESLPKLSFMAADYDDIHLEKDYFDLAFINGSEMFDEPGDIISAAKRLVKNEGTIIVYSDGQPLLASCFQLVCPERDEYVLKNNTMVLKSVLVNKMADRGSI